MSAHTATQLHINEFEDISRRSHGFWTKAAAAMLDSTNSWMKQLEVATPLARHLLF